MASFVFQSNYDNYVISIKCHMNGAHSTIRAARKHFGTLNCFLLYTLIEVVPVFITHTNQIHNTDTLSTVYY